MAKKPENETFHADIDFHYDRLGQRLNFVCRQTGSGYMPLEEFLKRADIPLGFHEEIAEAVTLIWKLCNKDYLQPQA